MFPIENKVHTLINGFFFQNHSQSRKLDLTKAMTQLYFLKLEYSHEKDEFNMLFKPKACRIDPFLNELRL